MGKFKARFEGYPEDLVRVVGMAMNGLIRRICDEQGAKPVRSTFLRPETATPEWLVQHVEMQVAVALFQRPEEKRTLNELCRRVAVEYQKDIEDWIEENKVNLAEIGFLFSPEDGVTTAFRPVQVFGPVAPLPPAGSAQPGPTPKITGFICRRGRKA